jgi:signal transduction histidine kinase
VLHEFLTSQRAALIELCRSKVVKRRAPRATDAQLEHGIPLFLDQLIKTLKMEQTADPMQSRQVSGPSGGNQSVTSEIGAAAALHGLELLAHGFTIDQVVHDYGDLCQAITEMASESAAGVQIEEFQTLNRCLDNAIAEAVTEFSKCRESLISEREIQALNERMGALGHELRNLVHIAKYAFEAVKRGSVGPAGATAAALDRSLNGLTALIDRALVDVRVIARMPVQTQQVSVADLISEVHATASMDARARNCEFTVAAVDRSLAVKIDRNMMIAAVGNLLQNAFKFTHPHSAVSLEAYAKGDRVRIDTTDQCGGLPHGFIDTMFLPFTQGGHDKSGLGLGLSIARRTIEAHDGILSVRDLPGVGCVFTIDLPRHAMPGQATVLNDAGPSS